MKRRDLIKLAGVPVVAAIPAMLEAATVQESTRRTERVELSNRQFKLTLDIGRGIRCRLVHLSTGTVLADGPYFYSFGDPDFADIRNDGSEVIAGGMLDDGLKVDHSFRLPVADGWLEERIVLTNTRKTVRDMSDLRCGFTLPIMLEGARADKDRFSAVPYIREPESLRREYHDYDLGNIVNDQFISHLWITFGLIPKPVTVTSHYASEGWAWRRADRHFLITKYGHAGMEWAILDSMEIADGGLALRWGGVGVHLGNPEKGARIPGGKSHDFGVTRLSAVEGGRTEAFYAFRSEMERRGHKCPANFDPPLHWNELYDNKLFMLPNNGQNDPEMRKKYYALADMKGEAAKAVAYSCEALYLDPGWDTNFASKIWDERRLGKFRDFTAMLKRDYNLRCSLHTPLAGWCDPSSYSKECYRTNKYGELTVTKPAGDDNPFALFNGELCGASDQYVEETARRLKKLAGEGAVYFMFDGTPFQGECWSKDHGHPVPSWREPHVEACMRLARMVHEDYPDVLVEMHDPIMPYQTKYIPTYYGHAGCYSDTRNRSAAGYDTVWAFELMWSPMEDLLSGKSLLLYYYNLAYSLPLYNHISLKFDNIHCLTLWWHLSTCRHMGIGGTHEDPKVAAAQRAALKEYRRLKPYYASGVFYGLGEETHVHAAPDRKSAVMNCFNLEDKAVERTISFKPAEIGLDPSRTFRFKGAAFRKSGEEYVAKLKIPALGHVLVEIA